ncbi:MAG TPA: anthranilate synthase component I [Kiritimatiellia bacterium]|nr:anthranilate synthase component I [Kiritimatiellia bacterium]HMO99949.1 anthranilate synthase component I [Kiritimatiellia bacterium]HMP97041.1 anthranilate synthase component I [Kiritimatiellia bacterium]
MAYLPSESDFLKRAQHGNLVPVWRELLADQETPVSAYERLRAFLRRENPEAATFLLESVEGGEKIARYSFLGGNPHVIFQSDGRNVTLRHADGRVTEQRDVDPVEALRGMLKPYRPVHDPALPRFYGGLVGYMGYDVIPQFEPRVGLAPERDQSWPDMQFMLTDTILIFDHVRHTAKVVANVLIDGDPKEAYRQAISRIDRICDALSRPVAHTVVDIHEKPEPVEVRSNLTREAFEESVRKAQEFIRAGDIIQVVLSQRFETDYDGDPLDVYRALRCVNPSPYMFCLEFGERKVVGSSPEVHVRLEDGRVEVRPIAGTRPRSDDPHEDVAREHELLADPKERAEHIMLVDLARNDLGRVCAFRSVQVPELMIIERYSHVMHIVSDVTGDLVGPADAFDVMQATFPAGTVSGAPKIRAMEIIAELERTRRGPYAGAVGYFGFGGNLDSCITIRTVLLDGKKAYVQAGAGIVADSVPEAEFEETRNKARGMMNAIALSRLYAKARRGEASP